MTFIGGYLSCCFRNDVGDEATVSRDEHKTLIYQGLGFRINFGLVAALPAAAMNPEGDWMLFASGWGTDIERLPLAFCFRIGQIALDLHFRNEGRGCKEQGDDGCVYAAESYGVRRRESL